VSPEVARYARYGLGERAGRIGECGSYHCVTSDGMNWCLEMLCPLLARPHTREASSARHFAFVPIASLYSATSKDDTWGLNQKTSVKIDKETHA
jgi:hypothetical protein